MDDESSDVMYVRLGTVMSLILHHIIGANPFDTASWTVPIAIDTLRPRTILKTSAMPSDSYRNHSSHSQ